MSDEQEEIENEEQQVSKTASQKEQAQAMSSMSAGSNQEQSTFDAAKAERNVKALLAAQKQDQKAKLQREKELAAITVKKEDTQLLVDQLNLTTAEADRTLREHQGDVRAALKTLVFA
ncbi:huntingtin-interacting protein K-like [Planoprotostelium fungivorum]|uniref:Huntingtin-interacting protein K-like n=1 Tax=Planoprotostelium fungivorum TaxID=1890364 RepID=A0A2P6NQJ9_9EUKA|nr:huntingtin-interacting protein K-like [Planoprotostelium fungivorum]